MSISGIGQAVGQATGQPAGDIAGNIAGDTIILEGGFGTGQDGGVLGSFFISVLLFGLSACMLYMFAQGFKKTTCLEEIEVKKFGETAGVNSKGKSGGNSARQSGGSQKKSL